MNDVYHETFYFWVIMIFWAIIPAILGVGMLIFFIRLGNTWLHHHKAVEKTQWNTKWGHTLWGKPFIKDQGWGPDYSKLSKDEYLKKINETEV